MAAQDGGGAGSGSGQVEAEQLAAPPAVRSAAAA